MKTTPPCHRKPLAVLISAVCWQGLALQVEAAPCPAASSNVITVSGTTVDSTCSVGSGELLIITSTGVIDVPNLNGDAVQVAALVAAASINNAGLINSPYTVGTTTGDAVHLGNGASLSGALINSGTISGQRNAIWLDAATIDGGLQNAASGIITSTTSSSALLLTGGAVLNSGIDNSGVINGMHAIEVNGGTVNGGLHNQLGGSINDGGNFGFGVLTWNAGQINGDILNEGVIDGGEGALRFEGNSILTGNIINTGSPTGSTLHSSAGAAVGFSGGSQLVGDLINSGAITGLAGVVFDQSTGGNITNATGGTITGTNSHAIEVNNSAIANLSNAGAITVSGGSGHGVLLNAGQIQSALVNEGTITGTSSGVNLINGSSIGSALMNLSTGVIQGNGSGIRLDGSIIGEGILNAGQIHGFIGVDLTNTSSVALGGIVNAAGAQITGNSAGIRLFASEVHGDISNDGIIDGGELGGLHLTAASTLFGSVLNAADGTLSSTANAGNGTVTVNGSTVAGALLNEGSITNTGAGDGVRLSNTSSLDSLDNRGAITAQTGAGIYISASTVAAGINNSGMLTGGGSGLHLDGATVTAGGIVNAGAGVIRGADFGIDIDNASQVTGDLVNGGTIGDMNGVGGGIALTGTSVLTGAILNSGTLTSAQGLASATLYIANANVTGGVSNTGTLGNTGSGAGITVAFGATVDSIDNGGSIAVAQGVGIAIDNGTVANGIDSSGSISGSDGIDVVNGSTVTGGIANSGAITANRGIVIDASTVTGNIANAANASISGGSTGIALINGAVVTGSITNGGTIAGDADHGILIQASGLTGTLDNSGTISGANAIALINPTTAIVINNSGWLDGAVLLGAQTLNLDGGSARVTGPVSGVGGSVSVNGTFTTENTFDVATITVAGSAVLNAAHALTASSGIANLGTLNNTSTLDTGVILNSGTLNLNGTAARVLGTVQGGAVNVNGTFTTENTFDVTTMTIASTGTLHANHALATTGGLSNQGTLVVTSAHPLSVTGNYTQTADATFSMNAISPSVYGTMTVSGTATLAPHTGIFVDVADGAPLIPGGVLPGVITAGTLQASSFTVTDNSALFNFTGVVNGNAVDLNALSATTVEEHVIDNRNFAGSGAAQVFDRLIAGGSSGDMASVVSALGALPDGASVSQAVEQTLPLLTGTAAQATIGTLEITNRIVQAREEVNLGLSSGDGFVTDRVFWLKPFGAWSKQDRRRGISGYEADSGGLVIGADGVISNASRLGLAFAYARTNLDSRSSVSQSAEIDSYQAILYGSHSLRPGTDLNFQLDVGTNENKGDRTINFGGLARKASSDYSAWSTHAGVGLGHLYRLGTADTLTASVRLDYTALKNESYTERGADALNLRVKSQTADQLIAGVDGKLHHRLNETFSLVANLGAGYDLINDDNAITASFVGGGAAFSTEGLDPSPWLYRGGLGLIANQSSGLEITARYDIETRASDFRQQTVSLKLRMPF